MLVLALVRMALLVRSTGMLWHCCARRCSAVPRVRSVGNGLFYGEEETEDLHVLRTLLPGAIIPIHTAALSLRTLRATRADNHPTS